MRTSKIRRLAPSAEKATAYHEAGHAIVAYAIGLGLRNAGVSIERNSDTDGRVHLRFRLGEKPEFTNPGRGRLRMEKRVIAGLAGSIAQREFSTRSVRRHHASTDFNKAIDVLMCYVQSPEELDAYLHLLEIRASTLVDQFWSQIQDLAEELLKRKHLTGPEVASVFNDSVKRMAACAS